MRNTMDNLFMKLNNFRRTVRYKEIMTYVKIIIISILVAVIFDKFIVVNSVIVSDSMCDQIKKGDRLIANRLSYLLSNPKRGDIIVFKFPDNESEDYIKRIIGLPGDTIEIKSGVLYINGQKYQERYIKETMVGDFGPYNVPEDHYFVLGDNRNVSLDSRYWHNKYVSKKEILGKAVIKYYPTIKFLK